LISLSHDDAVYKDDMRDAGLPGLLASLFGIYQANSAAAELRPVAAQVLRCLQLMAAGDAGMQDACVQVGLLQLLVSQLHLDIHSLDEPPLPAAALNILSLNSLPSTPKSPHVTGAAFEPSAGASGGRRGAAEPSIPEDKEADLGPGAAAGRDSATPGRNNSLGGRGGAFANHGSEAAALRGLGAGPSPLQRLAAALLLRVVLAPRMSSRSIEVLLHGMLLPALHMQVGQEPRVRAQTPADAADRHACAVCVCCTAQLVGPRLSLAFEATCTLRALLVDSPERAAAAVQAGAAPLLIQVSPSGCTQRTRLGRTADPPG
jgi:hypothetical protein